MYEVTNADGAISRIVIVYGGDRTFQTDDKVDPLIAQLHVIAPQRQYKVYT